MRERERREDNRRTRPKDQFQDFNSTELCISSGNYLLEH